MDFLEGNSAMTEETSQDMDGSFDLDRVRELIEMMEKHDLSEVNLKRGSESWRLRRGNVVPVAAVPTAVPAAVPALAQVGVPQA